MSTMDFFRRPVLAGKVLQRLSSGIVRGNIRRSDPDVTSPTPYFPGASTGDTLELDVDGSPFTVTLTGADPDLQSILDDINTELTGVGQAVSADGSIEIQSLTPGGYLEVTGGTAATDLGFDVNRTKFRSSGGDIRSTPEARLENPFGSGFAARGENLTVESFNRGLARLSSNLDVLYSEHMRRDARMTKVAAGSTSVATVATGTSLITLPAGTQAFTALNVLSSTPTPEELSPYVQLIDTTTGLPPATCRVVGIVRGAVAGSPPYADAGSFGGAGNVIDVDLIKATVSVTNIEDGRVVTASAANFSTNGTVVGDWAEFVGATNVSPWSNNGYRWVVEEIIDATHIALRPMSQSEYVQANPAGAPTEAQPFVELNDTITGLEVFGSLRIRTGTFTPGVKLVVQPQIPTGATYDVWLAQPRSLREATTGADYDFPRYANNVSQLDPSPNGIISGFQISGTTSSRTLSAGYVRMHGKILRIPATTYTPGGFGGDGTFVVYFDEADGRLKTATTTIPSSFQVAADPSGAVTDAVRHPIAKFVVLTGAFTGGNTTGEMARYSTPPLERITVGRGGDFSNILDAAAYVNMLAASFTETSSSLATYPHFEIVILNSITAEAELLFECPSISIRGANPLVTLNLVGAEQLTFKNNYFLKIEDLLVATDDTTSPFILLGAQAVADVGAEVYLRRVRHVPGAECSHIIQGDTGQMKKLVVDDCFFTVNTSISAVDSSLDGSVATQEIYVTRSYIPTDNLVLTPTMFRDEAGSIWRGSRLAVRDTVLEGWAPATGDATELMVHTNNTGDAAEITVEGVKIITGTFASGSDVLLIRGDSATVVRIRGLTVVGELGRIVLATAAGSFAEDVVASVRPEASNSFAISMPVVRYCRLTGNAPAGTRKTLILASQVAFGNVLSGEARGGISATGSTSVCIGNSVNINTGTETGVLVTGISVSGRAALNNVTVTTTSGWSSLAAAISSSASASDKDARIEFCKATAAGCYAYKDLGSGMAVGCVFTNTTDNAGASVALARLTSAGRLRDCLFNSDKTLTSILISGSEPTLDVSDCVFPTTSANQVLEFVTSSNRGTNAKFSGCSFANLRAGSGLGFAGEVSDCLITENLTVQTPARVSGSRINGTTTVDLSVAGEKVRLTGSRFAALTATGSLADLLLSACSATGVCSIAGLSLSSTGNIFAAVTAFLALTVISSGDTFEDDLSVGDGTILLRLSGADIQGDLALVDTSVAMKASLCNVSVDGAFASDRVLRLIVDGIEITGAVTIDGVAEMTWGSAFVGGAFLVSSIELGDKVRVSASEFSSTLSMLSAVVTQSAMLWLSSCRVAGATILEGFGYASISDDVFAGNVTISKSSAVHLSDVTALAVTSITVRNGTFSSVVNATGSALGTVVTLNKSGATTSALLVGCSASTSLTVNDYDNAVLEGFVGPALTVSSTTVFIRDGVLSGAATFTIASRLRIDNLICSTLSSGGGAVMIKRLSCATVLVTSSSELLLEDLRVTTVTVTTSGTLALRGVRGTYLVATALDVDLNESEFTGVRTGSAQPNSISVTAAAARKVRITDCDFYDGLEITPSSLVTANASMICKGSHFGNGNAPDTTATYALKVNGVWEQSAIEGCEVLVDNARYSTTRSLFHPGNGVRFDTSAGAKILRLVSSSFKMIGFKIDDLSFGADPGEIGVLLVAVLVNSALLSACTFERVRQQAATGKTVNYRSIDMTAPGGGPPGIVVSGCMFAQGVYTAAGVFSSRVLDSTYLNGASVTPKAGLLYGDFDLFDALARVPNTGTA